MKLSDLAAQLIMIDIPGTDLEEAGHQHLAAHRWGGVLLFARNVSHRPQLLKLMEEIAEHGDPLVAVDQEGGLVDRVRFPDSVLTPGPMALAATGDPDCTRRAHAMMGKQLHELGFHIDFAPCVDINSNPDNPIIGVRSFGEDPAEVSLHARAACQGLREGGVAATIKHFPGHGACSLDSHLALPTLPHSLEQLQQLELVPFQGCLEAGVECVMTAHITFPALDPRPGRAATLSEPILTGLLRQQMGFGGVIFSDSMEMQAIANHYGVGEASLMAIEAGADMILSCGGFAEHLKAVQALVEAVESGRLTRNRLEESLQRIEVMRDALPVMKRLHYNPLFAEQNEEMRQIAERSVTLVRNQDILPLRQGSALLLSPDLLPVTPLGEMRRSDSILQHLKVDGVDMQEAYYPAESRGPALGHLLEQARASETVIFAVYARHRLPDSTRELGERLLQDNPRTVLVSLSSPYVLRDLPLMPAFVCSYNYTPLSLQALGRVISGHVQPQGRLPVTIPGIYERGHRLSYPAASLRG
ncbi:beta-N-acetylhexosaminidase [bacterium]|nr:beta-N-acetylhexosaminidase [bacterium]